MGSVGSPLAHSGCSSVVIRSGMDAIKKKMQAMKVEKDNACDKMDACEEAMKTAKVRAQKGEDEVAELDAKAKQLETELDLTVEKLGIATLQLEEKEKALSASELEMNALTRRVSGLEEDLEKTEEKLLVANQKFDKAATAADDSERMKKVLQNKAEEDEENSKKLLQCEADLERAEERADTGETHIMELEEELRVVANNLKSLEVAEEKANQREKSYKENIKNLTSK